MYADGFISNIRNNKTFGMKLGINDQETLNKFIQTLGINPIYKKILNNKKIVRIHITCDKIASDLEKNGVIRKKSNKIEFPKLKSRKFYLSFLLGYFMVMGQLEHQKSLQVVENF